MTPKQFATDVTLKLQQAGHTALWAGGCVRDALLDLVPKDFDIATSATPQQVRAIFGLKKTLSIGAAFGVITVIGPKSAGNTEVATFRRDGGYSDGRRPDSVQFTDARQDALRRDFTVNGMFFDPIKLQVIDYVGGREDLENRLIRAIGDPEKRIEEDKLRMMRGVRFASTFDFAVEPATFQAIQRCAPEIRVVSPERIGSELQRMLSHRHFPAAIDHLKKTGLWKHVLPEAIKISNEAIAKTRTLQIANENQFQFESVVASLLHENLQTQRPDVPRHLFEQLQHCWRLTNDQTANIRWLLEHWQLIGRAHMLPWSQLQPVVIDRRIQAGVDVTRALSDDSLGPQLCAEKIALPQNKLNPQPLLVGKDLIEMHIAPGPLFKTILNTVRCQQLDGEIETADQARAVAQKIVR